MSLSKIFVALVFAAFAAAFAVDQAAAATCESLASLKLSQTTITAAQSVPAGTYTAPDGEVFTNGSIAEFVGKRAVENAARRKRLGNLASAAVAEGGPFLPAVIVSERLSPSRVRFAAPESGAPLTASGRSEPVPLWRKGRTAKTPPRRLWIRRPCLESEPGYGKSQWRADLPPSSTP